MLDTTKLARRGVTVNKLGGKCVFVLTEEVKIDYDGLYQRIGASK